MVQVINDEFSGNVFGRLGKGIGKGLSEQLPKEIERSRLASGLKRFEKESQGLTPVQQFTRLAAIPGITPEHLYTLSPLLKQQAQRQEGVNRVAGAGGQITEDARPGMVQPLDTGAPAPQTGLDPYQEQTELAEGKAGLKTLGATQAQLTPIIRKNDEELMQRAVQLSQENPYTYPTPSDALPFARQEEDTRIRNLEEQRAVGDIADQLQQRIKQRLEGIWGKEATEKGIPGSVQTKLARNIEDDLANPNNKLSEQQLINKWGEIGKRIAQSQTNLDARAKSKFLSGEYTPKKIYDMIQNTRQVYADAGALEEFQDIIADKFNLTAPAAAYLAFPPTNTKANSFIRSIPSPSVSERGTFYPGTDPSTLTIKAADSISNNLTAKDSLLSYAMLLKQKGLDPKAFLDRVNQNVQAGLFKPSALQRQELQKGYPMVPSIGDLFLFWRMNKTKLVE